MPEKIIPAFVIDTDPVVAWPVTVRLPVSGGSFDDYQFRARLRLLSERGYQDLWAAEKSGEEHPLAEQLADAAQRLPQVIVGWEGVTDASGQAVPFTQDILRAQLTGPYGRALAAGLWQAVAEVRYGARLGNSAPLHATGSSDAAAAPTS